jgi:hypothetical protein
LSEINSWSEGGNPIFVFSEFMEKYQNKNVEKERRGRILKQRPKDFHKVHGVFFEQR